MTATRENFGDLLDPRFQRIFNDEYKSLSDYKDKFYRSADAKLYTERFSQVGAMPEAGLFTGTLTYGDVSQGYDTTVTPLEFAEGFSIQRRLADTDQYSIMDSKPKSLAQAMSLRKQRNVFRPFNNAFSVDTFFYNNSEGVALSSNSHTTTSGASTTSGFDNLVTTALSAVSVAAARIQFLGFRNDQAQPIAVQPDMLLVPPDLAEIAYEIVASRGKVGVATNEVNFHHGQYEVEEAIHYLTDTNNWYMIDSKQMKANGLVWLQAVDTEFAMTEDFDTFIASWRSYDVHGNAHLDWRWILGASVS